MIRNFLLVAFIISLTCTASAQGDRLRPETEHKHKNKKTDYPSRFKKIEAIKAGYITQRMDLTTEESQRFWPVYNKYQKEMMAIFILKKENMQSEGDAKNRLDKDLEFENKILAIRKHYKDEFLKVLPAEKVTLLTKCEREFKEQLIKQLKERRDKEKEDQK